MYEKDIEHTVSARNDNFLHVIPSSFPNVTLELTDEVPKLFGCQAPTACNEVLHHGVLPQTGDIVEVIMNSSLEGHSVDQQFQTEYT
jgi:hypothetical protein